MEIGTYTVLETVATRAFSVTYRASPRGLARTVLIKTLKPTVSAGSPFAAELEREAAILARLEDEAIVRLYDYTRTPDAIWLVLEDVRGVTLAELVKHGPIAPEQATAIALSIARGLAHAHGRGIVHRALRPEIVLVTAGGAIKITELSTADADANTEAGSTRVPSSPEPFEAGESFARPDYMAPERILGETAGARSDVWSLGVILHELLAGTRPFDAADTKEVAQHVRSGTPAPLPEGVPRAIERIVARCLAKAADDRYDSGQAVATALADALASLSHLPVPVLITNALAAAKLGTQLPASSAVHAEAPRGLPGPNLVRTAGSLGVVLALMVSGGAAIQALRDPDHAEQTPVLDAPPVAAGSRDKGLLRVLVRPWADVYVDGELVDVTPIGRPILVTPGKHFVTFRHPNAPDEPREIKIAAGQTVLLDVAMRIDRGDAGVKDSGVDAAESP